MDPDFRLYRVTNGTTGPPMFDIVFYDDELRVLTELSASSVPWTAVLFLLEKYKKLTHGEPTDLALMLTDDTVISMIDVKEVKRG